LHTNLYRKSLSLRKTKTDRVDARTIATMLMSDVDLKSYTDTSYHNEELKSLTRYRFDKVRERAKLKTSISRLVCILFPEMEKLVPTLHLASVYALLSEFPGSKQIASAHLTRLTNLLHEASKGRYGREKAIEIRDAARNSIGSAMPAKSLELKHTIRLIGELDAEIEEIEKEINSIMDAVHSPITTIPGIGNRMGAMILAEVGDFSNFDSPDKILAYAGLSPSTYQSGQLTNCYSHMEKRGSRYLRYAIFNATKYVCIHDPTFAAYLARKRAEGKHYNVAISHAAKKLVRLIYAMEKSQQSYRPAA
ncbi:MAG: IS110 family transposase, partial [Clostridiales bacterium]|nr:IS110 family transposase [Clostridiales bacterium]